MSRDTGRPGFWEQCFAVVVLFLSTGALGPLIRQQPGTSGSITSSEGDPAMQIVWTGVYMVTLLLLLLRWDSVATVAPRDKVLWALVGLAVLSVLWSTQPEFTIRRSFALVGTTLFGVYLAARYSFKEQLRLLVVMFSIVTVLSLLVVAVLPTYGIAGTSEWRGIYAHKNQMGRLMALSAIVCVMIFVGSARYRRLAGFVFVLSMGLMVMSKSRTSLVIFVVLMLIFPLARAFRWHHSLALPFFLTTLTAGTIATLWLADNLESLLAAIGKDLTLTGRTELWAVVFEMIKQKLWLGYSYGGFWRGYDSSAEYVWELVGWNAPHSHSGFLDIWLDLGLVGLLLFVFGLLSAFKRAIQWLRSTTSVEDVWPLMYCTYILLFNMTESAALNRNNIFWCLFVATVLSMGPTRGAAPLPSSGDDAAREISRGDPRRLAAGVPSLRPLSLAPDRLAHRLAPPGGAPVRVPWTSRRSQRGIR